MVAGSAAAVTVGNLRKGLLAFAAAQFALYAVWTLTHDDFIYVIADTGTALATGPERTAVLREENGL